MLMAMRQKAAHPTEVFPVDSQSTETQQEILTALREISDNAELQAEAKVNPESVLNRLKLSGIARHSVALGIAALVVTATAASPTSFWQ
jgi:hypothetical protein